MLVSLNFIISMINNLIPLHSSCTFYRKSSWVGGRELVSIKIMNNIEIVLRVSKVHVDDLTACAVRVTH